MQSEAKFAYAAAFYLKLKHICGGVIRAGVFFWILITLVLEAT